MCDCFVRLVSNFKMHDNNVSSNKLHLWFERVLQSKLLIPMIISIITFIIGIMVSPIYQRFAHASDDSLTSNAMTFTTIPRLSPSVLVPVLTILARLESLNLVHQILLTFVVCISFIIIVVLLLANYITMLWNESHLFFQKRIQI
jgi:hypothetical protein